MRLFAALLVAYLIAAVITGAYVMYLMHRYETNNGTGSATEFARSINRPSIGVPWSVAFLVLASAALWPGTLLVLLVDGEQH